MDDDNALTHGLWRVAQHLTDDPRFMAYELARSREQGQDPADMLGLDDDQLARLALCKRPRHNKFRADVAAIAAYIGMDADRLARLLR